MYQVNDLEVSLKAIQKKDTNQVDVKEVAVYKEKVNIEEINPIWNYEDLLLLSLC